ncbi:MAG: DEAD/DEAH box helicase [Armatimonadota bacterium]
MEERMWCPALHAWVRVLERRELFGETTALVLPEGGTQVHTIAASELLPECPFELSDALSTVAGARIWHALGSDLFFAPLVSRVIPLPHQFRVLRQTMATFPVRKLLADEVGLGKTIEAGLVLKELKLRGMVERVLVLAPKSLQLQWIAEMERHFDEVFDLVEPGSWGLGATLRGDNPWKRYTHVVTSFDAVKPKESQKGWSTEKIERFNLDRFHDLVGAGWDLVIIDESHKVAGASDDVARFELAKGVAGSSPHLLLLSATPHSGKSDAFRRLLSLLDPQSFPNGVAMTREAVAPFVIRTEKRSATDADGKPLFMPRITRLITVPFRERHALQQRLYEDVSEYVIEGYNQAQRSGAKGSRLLLILIQRLMSSSTRAILNFLDGRLTVLTGGTGTQVLDSDDPIEIDEDAETAEQLALFSAPVDTKEVADVQRLLELALQVQQTGPDARAEALYDLMISLIQEDSEPSKKFLVFTEFTSTQQMLKEFLEQRGMTVATLNGSMDLEERKAAQEDFRGPAQVLVSTDAGGEGLNLQFAHVVFNYDLPWNPMRVEQRIGRVDRIGQPREVKAFNLVLENSVEARIYEVLQQKLETILQEFGVDKTGDVLDSREAGAQFTELARTALLRPEVFDSEFERVLVEIRTAAQESQRVKSLYTGEVAAADRQRSVPLRAWLTTLMGDTPPDTDDDTSVDLSEVVIQRVNTLRPYYAPGTPVPSLRVDGLGFTVDGWFALWKVGIAEGLWRHQHVFAAFLTDGGDAYATTAQRIWDALATRSAEISHLGEYETYDYATLEAYAQSEAGGLYERVLAGAKDRSRRRKIALDVSYLARRTALARIGIDNIREARRRELEAEYQRNKAQIEMATRALPDLQCLFLARVSVL